uniref:Uncharacterized protein n=1 Tax=Lotharella globosa TaxID=91324 RepID=A0A7S3Y879_9EUKA
MDLIVRFLLNVHDGWDRFLSYNCGDCTCELNGGKLAGIIIGVIVFMVIVTLPVCLLCPCCYLRRLYIRHKIKKFLRRKASNHNIINGDVEMKDFEKNKGNNHASRQYGSGGGHAGGHMPADGDKEDVVVAGVVVSERTTELASPAVVLGPASAPPVSPLVEDEPPPAYHDSHGVDNINYPI